MRRSISVYLVFKTTEKTLAIQSPTSVAIHGSPVLYEGKVTGRAIVEGLMKM